MFGQIPWLRIIMDHSNGDGDEFLFVKKHWYMHLWYFMIKYIPIMVRASPIIITLW